MQFFSNIFIAASALATLAAANTVTFQNQDSTERQIIFTPQSDQATIDSIKVAGLGTETVTFPTGWIGNWYAADSSIDKPAPGMLGEVRFDGWNGATYYDVSAIVDASDHNNVKEIFPKNIDDGTMSGCQSFPCSNAYNLPDDIATIVTKDTDLVCLIGNLSSDRRRGAVAMAERAPLARASAVMYGRDFVEGAEN